MNINTKFNIGDVVYYIEEIKNTWNVATCKNCRSNNVDPILNKYEYEKYKFDCLTCDYIKYGYKYENGGWRTDNNKKFKIENIILSFVNQNEFLIEYMPNHIFYLRIKENNIFLNLEEALEECNIRNKGIKNEKY